MLSEGVSEAQVRLDLRKDEVEEAARGVMSFKDTTATGFVIAGMQLEEAQYVCPFGELMTWLISHRERIRTELTSVINFTLDRSTKIQERRANFFSKLTAFRKLQEHYMPAAIQIIKRTEDARDPESPPVAAEDIAILMPSSIPPDVLAAGCASELADIESKLREAQCYDSLALVRQRLHAKRYLINYRNGNSVGQKQMTKSRSLIAAVGERIQTAARKYRRARQALIGLRGPEACVGFKELREEDITLVEMSESDARALKKLGRIGGRDSRITQTSLASSHKALSWIWTGLGGPADEEKRLHDCKSTGP